MKKVTRGFLRIIMVFSAIVAFISASATDPTITINYNVSGLIPGASITVPLVIDAPSNNIGGFDLDINYNTDVLTYTSTNGQFIDLLLNGSFASTFPNQPTYKNRVTWSELSTYVTLNNQVICNLHFTYNGGSTALTLVLTGTLNSPGNSYIVDDGLAYLPATWNNGAANGAYVDIHSANGGGTWSTAAKWDLGVVPTSIHNVFITNANPITITTNVRCNNLTINSGGQLTLNSLWSLMVNGNCSLLDDATNGSGSYVDFGTTTIGGTCSVQRNMPGNWTSGVPTSGTVTHEIASPVSGGIIDTFIGDLLASWAENTQLWNSYTVPLGQPLVVGKGYAVSTHNPGGVKTFSGGTLNTGDKAITGLTFTSGGNVAMDGFNFIGNIYPSALVWGGWVRTNVDATAYIWNPGTGTYLTHNGVSGTGTFANGIIPAENGFFVHVPSGTGSITLPNTNRVHSTQAFYKQDLPDLLSLKLEGNNGWDEALIYFNPEATIGYDGEYDAYKLFGTDAATEIYSVIGDNTDASINVLPSFDHTTLIPVGIKTAAAGNYTLTASKLESFPSGTPILLEDVVAQQTVDLQTNPVYSFNVTEPGNGHRFNILFHPVGIQSITSGNLNIYSSLKDVYVNVPTSMSGNIVIYNLLGSEITTQAIQGNSLNRISLTSPTGYYIVKVIGDNGITTGKVFIQ